MSATSPRISVIVAAYERADVLELALESLAGQSFDDFEVLVADDGSGGEVKAVVERFRDERRYPVRHVWHEDEGFRKTVIVNHAVTEATSDYLVFIDGDCLLHHRFLERHFRRRKQGRALSGRRVMFDRKLSNRLTIDDVRSRRIERVGFWWRHAGKNDRKNGFYLPWLYWPRNLLRRDYHILGSNFSVHRDDFYRVNGYDERIIGRGLEDNNLWARFVNSGIEVHSVTFEALQYHCFHFAAAIPHSREFIEEFHDSRETRTPHGIVKD